MSNGFDLEVVPTSILGPIIEKFIKVWREERPLEDHSGNRERDFYSAYQWLEYEANVNPRRVNSVINQENRFVTLVIADKLLTAMGMQHKLGNEIPVVPNPRMTPERWAERMQERGCY